MLSSDLIFVEDYRYPVVAGYDANDLPGIMCMSEPGMTYALDYSTKDIAIGGGFK